jgi:uncharacterized protein (UPF0332 family)
MVAMSGADEYIRKAHEGLAGAEEEFANQRFNNCANRSYYACFHAARSALVIDGYRTAGGQWSHSEVQAEFTRRFINRTKIYPSDFRDTLLKNLDLRHTGDYDIESVSEITAARALRRARAFVTAVANEQARRR